MTFLAEQLKLLNLDPRGNRYGQSPVTFRTAISLYLRGRISYKELRRTVTLPHPKTIGSCFGKLETPGSIEECKVGKVFSTLEGNQLFCKIIIDEMHIAPTIRYRGNHLIGQSVDQPHKAARAVLGLSISNMFGGSIFYGETFANLLNHWRITFRSDTTANPNNPHL